MSQINTNSFKDSSGGNNAVLSGLAELKTIVETL